MQMLLLDILYAFFAIITSPVWLILMIRSGKIRTDWSGRFGTISHKAATHLQIVSSQSNLRKRILIHAVSVGEVNAIRQLVADLAEQNEVVIASTTNTGFARAVQLFADDHAVIRQPFDFSFSIRRMLNSVKPDLVVLVELEVWPNLTKICSQRAIPVAVVNGRISDKSYPRYLKFRPFLRPCFSRLSLVAAQDTTIGARFHSLGVAEDRIFVTGTLKWDAAAIKATEEETNAIIEILGLDRSRPIVVAGSTGPGEEALIHNAVPHDVQLVIAPRKPERFDEAASAMPGCLRRSAAMPDGLPTQQTDRTRFLLDSIGELKAAYAIADLIIVGRTFCPLGGSDMIEPIALGKAVIVGRSLANFQIVAKAFLDSGGMVSVSKTELPEKVQNLLDDDEARSKIAQAGLRVIADNKGVTERCVSLLSHLMDTTKTIDAPTRNA